MYIVHARITKKLQGNVWLVWLRGHTSHNLAPIERISQDSVFINWDITIWCSLPWTLRFGAHYLGHYDSVLFTWDISSSSTCDITPNVREEFAPTEKECVWGRHCTIWPCESSGFWNQSHVNKEICQRGFMILDLRKKHNLYFQKDFISGVRSFPSVWCCKEKYFRRVLRFQ